MKFGFGKGLIGKRSIEEIEAEAAAEIEQRGALGKPPAEDFAAAERMMAERDASDVR